MIRAHYDMYLEVKSSTVLYQYSDGNADETMEILRWLHRMCYLCSHSTHSHVFRSFGNWQFCHYMFYSCTSQLFLRKRRGTRGTNRKKNWEKSERENRQKYGAKMTKKGGDKKDKGVGKKDNEYFNLNYLIIQYYQLSPGWVVVVTAVQQFSCNPQWTKICNSLHIEMLNDSIEHSHMMMYSKTSQLSTIDSNAFK